MNKIVKILVALFIFIIILALCVFCYFFAGSSPIQKNITWGVDFSQMQAQSLKTNWKESYLAILDDLGAKNIKLHTQWDFVEGEKDTFYFDDIDWQLQQAKERSAKIIYVVGIKTGRWPECHTPVWMAELSENQQQEEALAYIKKVVERYKDNEAIIYWQVENEPLLNFGECPEWYYKNDEFLKKEVALVKFLDSSRKVIISDSGELNWWFNAAKSGDIVGTTMYRKAWVQTKSFGLPGSPGFYGEYLFPPVFYWRKAKLVETFFSKEVVCIELQAEPWAWQQIYDISLDEQKKTMDLAQFKSNVEYAKKTGLDTFYFWGVEWWYWMKTVQNQPEIWNEAKNLFK
jgi:hypothetical protein